MSYYDNNHVAANCLTHQTILFASITTRYACRVRAGSSASKLSATITPDGQGARLECIISI
ncbi:hypothetical protein DK762_05570 [Salmonella enterica subsp. houtenae]|nr:hypothetical protein [Salmonella enterica subsp. houtenae]ECI3706308.1 hypothetical protein [Salmonella enterica subsp. houtenae]MLR84566.1 hypothetical protein [Salmonella enterica subsp. houtenae]